MYTGAHFPLRPGFLFPKVSLPNEAFYLPTRQAFPYAKPSGYALRASPDTSGDK